MLRAAMLALMLNNAEELVGTDVEESAPIFEITGLCNDDVDDVDRRLIFDGKRVPVLGVTSPDEKSLAESETPCFDACGVR